MMKQHFGALIRSIRMRRKEPLRVIAAAVGIDSTLLSKLERGERLPTEMQISNFAQVFQLSETELKGIVIAEKMMTIYDDADAVAYAAQVIKEQAETYMGEQ